MKMGNKEIKIAKLMKSKLDSYGFTEDDLTQEELSQLKEEVEAELKGSIIMDGVLFSIPRYRQKQ